MTMTHAERAAFLAARRDGIGSSDSPRILGFAPLSWGGPHRVWQEKLGLVADMEPSPEMRRGNAMEPAIAEMAANELGVLLRDSIPMQRDEHAPFLLSHPDRVYYSNGEPIIVEIKSVSLSAAKQWGDPMMGSAGIPNHVWYQVQHQMLVGVDGVQVKEAYVAALVGHVDDLRIYHVPADPEAQALIVSKCGDFWHEHVLTRTAPPLDGSDAADMTIKLMNTDGAGWPGSGMITADSESQVHAAMMQLRRVRTFLDAQETEKKRLEQIVKAAIGEHEGAYGPGWKATYRKSKCRNVTDWEAVAKELGADSRPELVGMYTSEKSGVRTFRPTWE